MWLTWLSLACLDAPLVAISWQWLFATSLHRPVTTPERIGLFLTAWLIYLADRFADSVLLASVSAKSARQEFRARHIRLWIVGMIGIGMSDAFVAFRWIDHATLIRGIILGASAGIYLLVNLGCSYLWEKLPVKEAVVGCLFAAGTVIVFDPHLFLARSTMTIALVLFAAVCTLNGISIAVWERDLDVARSRHSIATRRARLQTPVRVACMGLAILCAGLVAIDPQLWNVAVCVAGSALLLMTIFPLALVRDEQVALADLALLTPIFLMIGAILNAEPGRLLH